jgi:hypothetical protein
VQAYGNLLVGWNTITQANAKVKAKPDAAYRALQF